MNTAHPNCPWVGECQCARDAQLCTCGHRNVSHGYGPYRYGSGIGNGPCGFDCDCTAFTPVEAHA